MALSLNRRAGESIAIEGRFLITVESIANGFDDVMVVLSVFNQKSQSTKQITFRKNYETVALDEDIKITLIRALGNSSAKIGITADRSIRVGRTESTRRLPRDEHSVRRVQQFRS